LSCGFHLRGLAPIPFESIYIQASQTNKLDIKRRIEASSKTIVLDSPTDAQATLEITKASTKKIILSVSRTGRVREFQLRYTLAFRVTNQKGQVLVPASKIKINRVLPFSDSAFLSSQMEEKMIVEEMQKDAILKLMDRLGKVKLLD